MTTQSRAWTAVGSSVVGLPAATLDEVTEQVALDARAERKYLVPVDRFAQLIARLPQAVRGPGDQPAAWIRVRVGVLRHA